MNDDPTGTENTAPALRLVPASDPASVEGQDDPTGTQNTPPALRLIVTPASARGT
jgi:hypothetical protein